QWNQDYGQVSPEPQAPAMTSSAPNGASAPSDGGDDLSVPTSASSGEMASGIPGAAETPAGSRDLVAVVTDVLDVRIDPQGGDIVYAALPQHRFSLDSERPYVLLSD
ncbi:MAG: membrane protein insertase YidC, partial [Gammaproteobacteria bacterium]|nr:membrane protein insertase YidC [Gammaproteobacteria bacterium]